MSTNITPFYVRELERLIKEELFPVYKEYYQKQGLQPKYQTIDFEHIVEIERKQKLPLLLRHKLSD